VTTTSRTPRGLYDQELLLREAEVALRAHRIEMRLLRPDEVDTMKQAAKYLIAQSQPQALAEIVPIPANGNTSASEGGPAAAALEEETVPSDLVVKHAQLGERCNGLLMHEGNFWPKDVPVWACVHRHQTPSEAMACAAEELARRSKLPEAP